MPEPVHNLARPIEALPAEAPRWWWVIWPIALLAAVMTARWAAVWRESADFAHGWIVPIFAAYLAWERRVDRPLNSAAPGASLQRRYFIVGLVCAIAMGSMRLLLEPFPTWPAALWLFSICGWLVIGCFIAITCGGATARHFAFPILFTATALPWPTFLELNLIVPMRVGLASIAAEVIHALGYPAVAQGTVIEVGRGQVGVDEACSGVRSLQAAIMVALLLGEIFRLRTGRRWLLLVTALMLALVTNLARTCFLAWQGAVHGPEGVAQWHDVAGGVQMFVALGGMALVAWLWRNHTAGTASAVTPPSPPRFLRNGAWRGAGFSLAAVALIVEGGTQVWFGSAQLAARPPQWNARLPDTLRSYRKNPFTPSMQNILQCDSHQLGEWETPQGKRRAGYILNWERGHAARQVVSLHNPEICLPYSGQRFVASRGTLDLVLDDGSALAFRVSEFTGPSGAFFVYYLAWDLEEGTALTPAADDDLRAWLNYRLETVAARRRQTTACVVALAIYEAPGLVESNGIFATEGRLLLKAQK